MSFFFSIQYSSFFDWWVLDWQVTCRHLFSSFSLIDVLHIHICQCIYNYTTKREKNFFFESLCDGLDTWLIYSNFIAATDVDTVLFAWAGSDELSCSKLLHYLSYVYDCSVYGGGRYLMARPSLGTCGIGGILHVVYGKSKMGYPW